MKKLITLIVVAVVLSGIFVSCSKKTKTSEEKIKKKIETNFENTKKLNKKFLKPTMNVDLRKLRRTLKKGKKAKNLGKENKQTGCKKNDIVKKDQKAKAKASDKKVKKEKTPEKK